MSTSAADSPASFGSLTRRLRGRWLEVLLLGSLVALIVQLFPVARRIWREWPSPGHQTPGRASLVLDGNTREEIEYYVYLPPSYTKRQQWPLMLYLHGAGERGDHELKKVLRTGPAANIAKGRSLPMIVVTPQCRSGAYWDAPELLALLDAVEDRFSVDKDQIYVAGFSMGGFGTWELISAAPDRFAAAVPVAGGGDPDQAKRLVDLPIWAFHGRNDKSVELKRSTQMIDAIKTAGGHPKFTIYPNAGHSIDQETFRRDDIYQWLLKQRRTSRKTTNQSAQPTSP